MPLQPRHTRNRRLAVGMGVVCLGLLAAATWTAWDALVERYHRLLLRHASEASAFRAAATLTTGGEESLELVRAWALDSALKAARAPDNGDSKVQTYRRDVTIRDVARAVARRGDLQGAETAILAMSSSRQPSELEALRKLASAPGTPATGTSSPSVVRPAAAALPPAEVAHALETIRLARAPADGLGAARAAGTLLVVGRKDEAREGIALALRLASQLPDRKDKNKEDEKAAPFAAIARVLWQLGDVEESRELFTRAAILSAVGNAHLVTQEQAELGDVEGTTRTARAIQQEMRSWSGLDRVAAVQIERGELQAARAIAEELRNPWLMAGIGAEQRRRGDIPGGERSFEQAYAIAGDAAAYIPANWNLDLAHGGIAHVEARSGQAHQALALARRETIPYYRASLLLGVATGLEERLRELAARRSRTGSPSAADGRP